jgi:orotate phosphoribosyltransferase
MYTEAELIKVLINVPNLLYYDPSKPIQFEPGKYAPIFIDLRTALAFPKARDLALSLLRKKICELDQQISVICGVESGASYYASLLANIFNKPLCLVRKKEKKYGKMGRFVGYYPKENDGILFVDDVLATGYTISEVSDVIKPNKERSSLITIFTYGFNNEIEGIIGMRTNSLFSFDQLCGVCLDEKIFSPSDIMFLSSHIQEYRSYFPNKRPN